MVLPVVSGIHWGLGMCPLWVRGAVVHLTGLPHVSGAEGQESLVESGL